MEQETKKSLPSSVKYGSDQRTDGDDFFNEAGYRQSRENDKIDFKYGFSRVKDSLERTGYLINMHSTEILDEDRRLVAALDLFFIQMDGGRFKCTVAYKPYFLIRTEDKSSLEVARFLGRKYSGHLAGIEHIMKEDLDLPNHLSGLQQAYIYQALIPKSDGYDKSRDNEIGHFEFVAKHNSIFTNTTIKNCDFVQKTCTSR